MFMDNYQRSGTPKNQINSVDTIMTAPCLSTIDREIVLEQFYSIDDLSHLHHSPSVSPRQASRSHAVAGISPFLQQPEN